MKKKLNKLICILLCILLISLSIVPVSADSYTELTPALYCAMVAGATNCTFELATELPSWLSLPSGYDISLVCWVDLYNAHSMYTYCGSVIPDGYYEGVLITGTFTSNIVCNNVRTDSFNGTYNGTPVTPNVSSGGYAYLAEFGNNSTAYCYVLNDFEFSFSNVNYKVVVPHSNPVYPSNPNYPTGNPYDPTVPQGWDNYTAMIAGLLYDNFKFTCNNTIYNASWMPVGEYLMYDFLCKNNPQNDTVSFNNWEYQNYVYRICGLNHEDDVITIMELLDDISYYHGNYLASISNNLNYDPEYDLGFAYNVITPLNKIAKVYASDQEIEAREAAADNQQAVVDNFLDSQGDGSVSASNLGELADSSAEIKSNFNTGYSASGVWDVFDRNWDWFSNTTKNNLEPPAQNVRSVEDYDTPFLDNAINEILRLRGN